MMSEQMDDDDWLNEWMDDNECMMDDDEWIDGWWMMNEWMNGWECYSVIELTHPGTAQTHTQAQAQAQTQTQTHTLVQ